MVGRAESLAREKSKSERESETSEHHDCVPRTNCDFFHFSSLFSTPSNPALLVTKPKCKGSEQVTSPGKLAVSYKNQPQHVLS